MSILDIQTHNPFLLIGKPASGKTYLTTRILEVLKIPISQTIKLSILYNPNPSIPYYNLNNYKAIIIEFTDLTIINELRTFYKDLKIFFHYQPIDDVIEVDTLISFIGNIDNLTIIQCQYQFEENYTIINTSKIILSKEYEQMVTETYQQTKEDLNDLLQAFYPKEEDRATHQDKIQAMYENLIAMRNVALIPHTHNNSL